MKTEALETLRRLAWLILVLAAVVFFFALASFFGGGGAGLDWFSAVSATAGLALVGCGAWIFAAVRRIDTAWEEKRPEPEVAPAPPPAAQGPSAEPGTEALLLLSLLQEKGRFVDFVMEDVASYTNDQVGAAARVVHQGCREVISEAFAPQPISPGEDKPVTLEPGYDAAQFRVVGKVQGHPPFQGKITHHGWRARQIKLPRRHGPETGDRDRVIVPAEVAV